MSGKYLIYFLAIVMLVGVVSADTLIVYADNTNQDAALVRTTDGTYTSFRNGAGESLVNTTAEINGARIYSTSTSNTYDVMTRFGWTGNTSTIGTGTINSAIFGVYGVSGKANGLGATNIGITGFSPTNNLVLNYPDYNTFSDTRFATDITYAGWNEAGYNNWTLNGDGLAAISKTGYTKIMVRQAFDIDNTTPTWASEAHTSFKFAETSKGVGYKPFLQIDYTPAAGGDTTPPASISNLANTTTCNSINWTWTNPGGDQNETVIWKDGVLLKNVTNTTTFDLWESLSEYTEYTFSSKTKDIAGNLNATFVNQTARTLGDPIAAFSCTPLSGAVPLSVTCTDASTRAPTTWVWYNNTTQVSTSQSPTFSIATIGDQDISLNASNTCGFDWENKTDYITTSASGCGLICKIILYIRQFYLPYQMVRL